MASWRFLACALVFWGLASAHAGDWPRWGRTTTCNMVSDEKNLPDTFEPGQKDPKTGEIDLATAKNVKWVAKLGGACYGTPVVAHGRVYVGTDDLTIDADPRFARRGGGMVKCFDEASGKLLWQLLTQVRTVVPPRTHFIHQKLGVCSSPAVEGDRVYIVSSAAEVLCLDAKGMADGNQGPYMDEASYLPGRDKPPVELRPTDADILWRFDLIDELGVLAHDSSACSVLIHGDVIYLSTSNGMEGDHKTMPAPGAPAIVALDKRTGRLLATEDEKISARLFHAQWCSPSVGVVNGRTLILFGGGDGVCYAFEPVDPTLDKPVKLKKVWSYDCNPPEFRLRDGVPIKYLEGDKLLNRSGPNNNDGLYLGPNDVIATPVLVDGKIYVGIGRDPTDARGRGLFHCIDPTGTGDITQSGRVWMYSDIERTVSTAAIVDGLVYIPDISGKIHCLDQATGKRVWMYDAAAETWGGALAADGKIYVGNKKDLVIMAQGREPKVLARIPLGSPIYCTPVAANGTVYIASQRYLWAVAKPAQ